MGTAIGMHPKGEDLRRAMDIETQLGNIDRCRTLYEKALELGTRQLRDLGQFAELENQLGETERARGV